MTQQKEPRSRTWEPKILSGIVIALTWVIFGAAILLVTQQLRQQLRQQIAGRDGEILYSVAQTQIRSLREEFGDTFLGSVDNPFNLEIIYLETSRSVDEIVGARLFNPDGELIHATPLNTTGIKLGDDKLKRVRNLDVVSEFRPEADLGELFVEAGMQDEGERGTLPILAVTVPLHSPEADDIAGVAEFFIDGESIAEEYAALDRHLFRQAGVVFAVGSVVIVLALGWAFQRLQRSNRLLQQRTNDLLRANQELTVAAKSSAVGAVTAHLMHGLKNPLFALRMLANQLAEDESASHEDKSKWQTAVQTTDRIQNMVNEVTRVISDDHSMADYVISLAEVKELVESKCRPMAREAGVFFHAEGNVEGNLSNRAANLVLLILQNLVHNAVQVTPEDREIRLVLRRDGEGVLMEVQDQGPGIPEEVRTTLFQPQRKSHNGGSGIGLAISKQLANHLGVALELRDTSENGSTFLLRLPPELLVESQIAFSDS